MPNSLILGSQIYCNLNLALKLEPYAEGLKLLLNIGIRLAKFGLFQVRVPLLFSPVSYICRLGQGLNRRFLDSIVSKFTDACNRPARGTIRKLLVSLKVRLLPKKWAKLLFFLPFWDGEYLPTLLARFFTGKVLKD